MMRGWVKSCHRKYWEAELHERKLAESGGIVNCTKEWHREVIVQRGNMNGGDKNNRNDDLPSESNWFFSKSPNLF